MGKEAIMSGFLGFQNAVMADEALEGASGGAYDALVLAGHGTETTLEIVGS